MQKKSVVLVAGEASSDVHGAEVMWALQRLYGTELAMFGIGGRHMRAAGLEPLVWAEEMGIMGLTEVLTAIPKLLRFRRYLLQQIAARRPDVVVLLDMPDFNLPIAKQLKRMGIPVVYFIGPQVWAWRASRVEQIRAYVDKLLVILPFEPAFYRRYGITANYVGHPLVEQLQDVPTQAQARQQLEIASQQPLVALLPGSRRRELQVHLPVLLQAFAQLKQNHPHVQAIMPVASSLSILDFQQHLAPFGDSIRLVEHGDARLALAAANGAAVVSGTATLEAGLLGTPLVALYKISALTYAIARRLVQVPSITLVNLILQQQVVPELLQEQANGQRLHHYLEKILFEPSYHQQLSEQLARLRQLLGTGSSAEKVAHALAPYLFDAKAAPV